MKFTLTNFPSTPTEQFRDYSEAGVEIFRVLSQRDKKTCPACYEHDGTEYSADEVGRSKPLPYAKCTNETCRCDYLPIIR